MQFVGTSIGTPAKNTNLLNTTAIPLLYIPSPFIPISTNGTKSGDLQNKCVQLTQENANLRKQNEQNSNIISEQKQKISLLERKMAEMGENMNKKIAQLETELETTRTDLDTKSSEINKIRNDLKNLLSESQLDVLTKKMERVHWTADDMAKAFTIYYFSKKCYLYLKHNLKYPLPGMSAVEKWASKNEVVLRIPAYEIFKGLNSENDKPTRKRRHV